MASPIKKYTDGQIELAIFSKQNQYNKTEYSFNVQKSWKDKEGKWQHTSFLSARESLQAKQLIDLAYSWTLREADKERPQQQPNNTQQRPPAARQQIQPEPEQYDYPDDDEVRF